MNNKDNIFESIKHIDDNGNEYWLARELSKKLEYTEWRNFKKIIKKAIINCENSELNKTNHFVEFNKMVNIGSNASRKINDYKLSRYVCYLIAQKRKANVKLMTILPMLAKWYKSSER